MRWFYLWLIEMEASILTANACLRSVFRRVVLFAHSSQLLLVYGSAEDETFTFRHSMLLSIVRGNTTGSLRVWSIRRHYKEGAVPVFLVAPEKRSFSASVYEFEVFNVQNSRSYDGCSETCSRAMFTSWMQNRFS